MPTTFVVVGAVAVIAVIAVIGVLVSRGGGDDDCLAELAQHLPADESTRVVFGTDFAAARDAGYEDTGALEDLGRTQRETGTYPGLLAQRLRFAQLLSNEEFTARTGVAPDDVKCSLSTADSEVSSGSFNPAEVAGSAEGDDGDLVATADHLALVSGNDDPRPLLEPRDDSLADDDAWVATLEALRDRDAYTLAIERADQPPEDGPRAGGVGVARGDDDTRLLVVAWTFPDDDAATAGRAAMADSLQDDFEGIASIAADGLEVDGDVVAGSFPLRQPDRWPAPLQANVTLLPRQG